MATWKVTPMVLDAAQGGRNAMWHTDATFVPTPPAASIRSRASRYGECSGC